MTISCTECCENLSAYVDGELDLTLDPTRITNFKAHLLSCADCESQHKNLLSLSRVLKEFSLASQELAPDIWSKLVNKLESTCNCIQNDFSAYLDGELTPATKDGVNQHLEQCQDCLQKFQELSQVNSLLVKGLELPSRLTVDLWPQVKLRLNDDCSLLKEDYSAFLDQEVPILRHRTIVNHLLNCGDCHKDFSLLLWSNSAIQNSYQPYFPENFDLWPQIRDKIQVLPFVRKEKTKAKVALPRLYQIAATVMLGVIVAATVFINSQSGSRIQPVPVESYLIESFLKQPSDLAEAVVYDSH